MLKNYLYLILAAALAAGWLVDRTRQFDKGKATCAEQIANAQAEYEKRHKDEEEKKIAAAVKEATKATEHIGVLTNEKEKAIIKTRTVVVHDECSKPSASWVLDYNEALRSLQRH